MSRTPHRPRRPRRPSRARSVAAALAAGLALLLAGCGGAAQVLVAPAAAPATDGARSPAPQLSTTVTVREISGRVSPADRRQVVAAVGRVVDTWLDRAYVGGRYPRETFSGAFASFTPQAARRARGDRALMTNAGVGARVEEARALQRRVRLDLLAPGGRVAGVTAQFALRQALSGQVSRRELVTGELFLTRQPAQGDRPGGWRVFGYEVRRARL